MSMSTREPVVRVKYCFRPKPQGSMRTKHARMCSHGNTLGPLSDADHRDDHPNGSASWRSQQRPHGARVQNLNLDPPRT